MFVSVCVCVCVCVCGHVRKRCAHEVLKGKRTSTTVHSYRTQPDVTGCSQMNAIVMFTITLD